MTASDERLAARLRAAAPSVERPDPQDLAGVLERRRRQHRRRRWGAAAVAVVAAGAITGSMTLSAGDGTSSLVSVGNGLPTGSDPPAAVVGQALARTIASGTARVQEPDGIHGVINFKIPAERLFLPGQTIPVVAIPTYTENVMYGHTQYLREVARSPAKQASLERADPSATKWRRQPITDTALTPLINEIGGPGGTYRYSGRSTFGGQAVAVYTITRPSATFQGMTVLEPRVVVLVNSDGRIVRYSLTQSESDKALHLHTKRTTTWVAFSDFGTKISISRPTA